MSLPRAVAFDFNGTLSHDEPILFSVYQEMFEAQGRPLCEDEYYGTLAGLSEEALLERSTPMGPTSRRRWATPPPTNGRAAPKMSCAGGRRASPAASPTKRSPLASNVCWPPSRPESGGI
jgi:hypothetical protein